jgi:hypothetical protein
MKYCPTCLEEYEDSTKVCSECAVALLTEDELSRRPEFRRVREDEDTTRFVVVGPAEDPFEADAFTSAVDEAGIPVFARMRHASSVDALTESAQHSWWEILVPAGKTEDAAKILEARRQELQAGEADAAKAAEEEELETEGREAKQD